MTESEKRARAPRIEEDIRALARSSMIVRELAQSKIGAVATSLARTLGERYSYSELESAIGSIIGESPSVKEEHEGSPQDRAAKEAERRENPTPADYAGMTASERLEAINRKKYAEIEAARAEARKREVAENGFDKSKSLTPAQRLGMANSWSKVGIDFDELDKRKPPSREEIRRWDANRRLSHANAETEAAKTKTGEKDQES